MADPFVAEIRIFPFAFVPRGWAWCDGQILPISQNTALYSLLGTYYGGDGRNTFGLPNLQGRAPMHPGTGPGLSRHDLGESDGTDTVTLLVREMPAHTHTVQGGGNFDVADTNVSMGNSFAKANANIYIPPQNLQQMAFQSVSLEGGGQPHNNMQPYLTLHFCIALQGVFPPRT